MSRPFRFLQTAALAAAVTLAGLAGAARASEPEPHVLVIRFAYTIPTEAFRAAMDKAAPQLAPVAGLTWKVWAIDEASRRASGLYLFADRGAADRYLTEIFAPHMGNNPALADIAIDRYGVMAEATRITRGRLD